MPRRDGTGPKGQGPMTGRGAGGCRVAGQGGTTKKAKKVAKKRGRK
jgi:hypothetical protein